MDKPQKRSMSVAGHRTSVSLEPEFWQALADLAKQKNSAIATLVAQIDHNRGSRNLSSAIRVWVLQNLPRATNDL